MHLTTRNVNTAFRLLVGLFADMDEGPKRGDIVHASSSRNGPVKFINEPMTITYTHPRERVLFNSARDANPFFHLYESLWMLAGRNDLAPLAYYVKDFGRFSDDGNTLNGAYGYRWRKAAGRPNLWTSGEAPFQTVRGYDRPGVDQLDLLVAHLKAQPDSRRAVLQMWNVEDDLLKISQSRDVCCNLGVMFSLRSRWRDCTPEELEKLTYKDEGQSMEDIVLDMTVTNRSNDLILGMLGEDYVHFSILQEYMAARLGVEVGVYNQFSNNLHVYESNWKPEEWLNAPNAWGYSRYWESFPLIKNPTVFELELPKFVELNGGNALSKQNEELRKEWSEPFFDDVAQPMLNALHCHKQKKRMSALNWCNSVKADDWRIAAKEWLERRYAKYIEKPQPKLGP